MTAEEARELTKEVKRQQLEHEAKEREERLQKQSEREVYNRTRAVTAALDNFDNFLAHIAIKGGQSYCDLNFNNSTTASLVKQELEKRGFQVDLQVVHHDADPGSADDNYAYAAPAYTDFVLRVQW